MVTSRRARAARDLRMVRPSRGGVLRPCRGNSSPVSCGLVSSRSLLVGCAALALCAGGATKAQAPEPAGIPDLTGARGVAMAAVRGGASGNDGIFNNPASLAARRRYAIEAQWLLDRTDGATAF